MKPNEIKISELIKDKGFTTHEAKILSAWMTENKPGLSKDRAEKIGEIYLLGYNCYDINKQFPEYPLGMILYARVYYGWDELRKTYQEKINQTVLASALEVKQETFQFLSEILRATNIKWRKQLLKYMRDPDKEKAPEFLPQNLAQYQTLVSSLTSLTPSGHAPEGDHATPLVSVNFNNKKEPDIVISNAENVKKALIKDVSGK